MSYPVFAFVGTYTENIQTGTGRMLEGKARGIHIFRFDSDCGALEAVGVAEGVRNPSYVVADPAGRFLYAVNEVKDFAGSSAGAVSAFAIDRPTGALTLLNSVPSGGSDPCHLIVDASGRYVLVANYSSGSMAVLPIRPDGSLGRATDVVQHEGASADPIRQRGPHVHASATDRLGRYIFTVDLGLDRVMIYRLDLSSGRLLPNVVPSFETPPGAGPRQLALHPDNLRAYIINELDSTMTACDFDAATGALDGFQTLSTLPAGFTGINTSAEVQVSPSGKFLYGSNRGHDSLVIYAIDESSGRLEVVGHEPTRGNAPRSFCISPSGLFIAVVNQNSDNLVVFGIDGRSGSLAATGHEVAVPTPVCVRFLA